MTSNVDLAASPRKHRTVSEQLHRSPRVIHASWMLGLAVILSAGVSAGDFNVAGVAFLVVLFSPIFIAYRRDTLSLPILFATLFLPAWPWALVKACSRTAPAV